jgi:2-succinyl-5-enolpyruvyl-6-hydroxy-3-cyclohexene-1-carboxylate synthase
LERADWEGRDDGRPWTSVEQAPRGTAGDDLATALRSSENGLVVCGGGQPDLAAAALELGRRMAWPVLAEPTSGVRTGPRPEPDPVIAHYDLLLRSEKFAAERPDLVLRVGEMPTSKPLRAWLEGCRQLVVDPDLRWHDPTRSAESLYALDAGGLASAITDEPAQRADAWLARWRAADEIVPAVLADAEEPFEPKAYAALAELADLVWVSSSMPIRDVESYFPRGERPIRFLANRGANGIDGVVSSAAGAALATGAPVHLVLGELALLHDVGGMIAARRAGVQLAILCTNNGGGGIFDFLPVAEHADRDAYEEHIATPVPVDLAIVAALGGLEHHVVATASDVRERLRPGTLVELRVERAESLRRHREVAARVTARLDSL